MTRVIDRAKYDLGEDRYSKRVDSFFITHPSAKIGTPILLIN